MLVKVMAALNFRLAQLGLGGTLNEQLRTRRCRLSLSLDRAASQAHLSHATVVALERGGGTIGSLLRLLAAIAPRVRQRAPERAYWGQVDKQDRDSRFTPPECVASIYMAFGAVDLDAWGHPLNPVVAGHSTMLGGAQEYR